MSSVVTHATMGSTAVTIVLFMVSDRACGVEVEVVRGGEKGWLRFCGCCGWWQMRLCSDGCVLSRAAPREHRDIVPIIAYL